MSDTSVPELFGGYVRPPTGIPAGDLATAVTTALGLAGTAVQSDDLRLRDGHVPVTSPADWPYSGLSVTGTNTSVTSKSKHLVVTHCGAVRVAWGGWYDNEQTPIPNDLHIKAYLETSSGTVYPILFSGAATVTCLPGQLVVSDIVPIDLRAGDTIYVRTYTSVGSTAEQWPLSRAIRTGEGRALNVDYSASGTLDQGTTLSNAPFAIWGVPVAYTGPTLGVVGASTITGQGDTSQTAYMNGWLRRAVGTAYPAQWVSVPGDTAQVFTPGTYQGRLQLLTGCSHIISGFGAGDLMNYGRTPAEFAGDLIRVWRAMQALGAYVAQSTIQPKTTSTNSWATVAGQSAADAGREANRVAVNGWLRDGAPLNGATFAAVAAGDTAATTVRAGAAGHPLTQVVDITLAIESAPDSGMWAPSMTADGLHPNTAGHTAISVHAGVVAALTAFLAT